jgi:hypothetical protein
MSTTETGSRQADAREQVIRGCAEKGQRDDLARNGKVAQYACVFGSRAYDARSSGDASTGLFGRSKVGCVLDGKCVFKQAAETNPCRDVASAAVADGGVPTLTPQTA